MSGRRVRTHVIARIGDADRYAPSLGRDGRELILGIQAPGTPVGARISDSVWQSLDRYGLSPSVAALDFYRLAVAVYAADARVLREESYDRWTRDLVLHLAVSDVRVWQQATPKVVELLQFLTGDKWELRVRAGAPPRPPADRSLKDGTTGQSIDAVSLLSGGLDSFIGALDAVADGRQIVLVSHNAAGPARFSSPAQTAVLGAIEGIARRKIPHLKATVSPPSHGSSKKAESSQRSRSIMFVGLGVLVASAHSPGTPLSIAENGFISLNVPLTYGRLGSHSTRTTHPYTLALMGDVISALGIATPILAPYHFMTKGEMLVNCRAQDALMTAIHATSSCARPNDRNADPARSQTHCGYCVPCIVRRAAMSRAGVDDVSQYRYDLHVERRTLLVSPERRKDLWAFEMALSRAEVRANITDVLRSGPIPHVGADADSLVGVYRNGLNEIAEFLRRRPLFTREK
jgi:hypothetical protein